MTDGSSGGASDSGKAKVTTTCDLVPDLDEAIRFLQHWSPNEAIISTSETQPGTGKKGNFLTRQFSAPVDWIAVRQHIAEYQRNGKWANIYFSVNPSNGTIEKKMSRANIGAMVALHVDVDVAPKEEQVAGIARIVNVFQHYKHPPSDIVTSGGGAQAFWRLKTPETVPDITVADDLKNYNRAIERDLEGDHCHNLDRIMRVPGTVNIPTETKVAKGRVPGIAHWHSTSAVAYDLSQFEKLPPENPAASAPLDLGGKFIDAGKYEPVRADDGRLAGLDAKWVTVGLEGDTLGDFTGLDGKVDRSRMLLAFCTQALRAHVPDDVIASIIMDPHWKVGECVRDKAGETKRQLKRVIERAKKFVDEDMAKPPVIGRDTWYKTAEKFIARVMPDLFRWKEDFYLYFSGCHYVTHDDIIKSEMRKFLNSALVMSSNAKTGDTSFAPFNPSNADVNELFGATAQVVQLDDRSFDLPSWRYKDADLPDPRGCLNLRNGILHVPTRAFAEHSPDFLTTSITTFDYDHRATCPLWKQALADWWPNKADGSPADESLQLQEMVGYSLLPETNLQKVFVVAGPGGSGKGTINKILQALVGKKNVASLSLGQLTEGFGAAPLMHKTICCVAEAAFGARDDRTAVTNFIKSVSGEDDVTVNRKFKDAWEGQLLCRFWLFCNQTPQFDDAGNALMRRLLPLEMTLSFKDNPDDNLFKKLKLEIAGILNWALEGYDRLQKNGGRFTMPESTLAKREQFGRMASPSQSFVEECCIEEPKSNVSENDLYGSYSDWCEKSGQRPMSKTRLIESVVAAEPAKRKRVQKSLGSRDARERTWVITGLELKHARKSSESAHDEGRKGNGEIPF